MMSTSKKFQLVPVLISLIFLVSSVSLSYFPSVKADVTGLEAGLASATGEERIEVLLKLTKAYISKDPEKVLEYGQEALELLGTISSSTYLQQRIVLLNFLSSASSSLGNLQEAEAYARQSQNLSQTIGDKAGTADALYNIGQVYFIQGNYNLARDYCSNAQKLYEEIDDKSGLARSFYIMAYIYWRLSDFSHAMEFVLKSADIYKKLDEPRGSALLDVLTGNIHADLGKYEQTLNYYFKSIQIFEELGDKEWLAKVYNNIGTVYTRQKNHPQAEEYFNKSLEIAREINSRQIMSYALNNMGEIYSNTEDYKRALDYFSQSLKIKEEMSDQMGIAYTLINIGKTRRKQGRYKEALEPLERALDIATKINIRNEMRNSYKELSEVYKALDDFPNAIHHLKKYKEINDWIFNESRSRQIVEMQTRYEMEKKKKEIDLLKKNKAIREAALTRQKNLNYYICIVSLLILIVAFVFYSRYRLKVKMTRALGREIEDHRQTTQKLQENEEKFRTLAETSVVGIYISQNDVIKYINPKFLTIFGVAREEILEQRFLKLVHEEDRPLVMEKIGQRITGIGDTQRYEFRGLKQNEEVIYLESYGGIILFQGEPAVLETIVDISDRKKTAETLLKSQKLEAMGILAGGIAHDFNNILSILVGYLEMVKDEIPANSPPYELVKNIENAYEGAADLAQKLTSFAKGAWITPREVTLNSILNSVIEENPEIEDIISTISIPVHLRPVYVDERQLKQVVNNLLGRVLQMQTGIKNPGRVRVSITAENINLYENNELTLEKGQYVRVFFTDNGWGIPAEQLEKIFEPSFSSPPTSQLNRKKLGLELAICQSIIKKHSGHIAVTSAGDTGTTFDLILPAYTDQPYRVC